MSNESKRCQSQDAASANREPLAKRVGYERICQDPKDGELRLGRVKPEEIPVEARNGTDVQIVRQT